MLEPRHTIGWSLQENFQLYPVKSWLSIQTEDTDLIIIKYRRTIRLNQVHVIPMRCLIAEECTRLSSLYWYFIIGGKYSLLHFGVGSPAPAPTELSIAEMRAGSACNSSQGSNWQLCAKRQRFGGTIIQIG